jgi:3-deoxy-D-manno-octulosonic-acid transferase
VGWALNTCYLLALVLAWPWVIWRRWRKGKHIGGFWSKIAGSIIDLDTQRPRIWLHAVSVGEVLCLKPIVTALQQHFPHYQLAISVTTLSGRTVAEKTFPDLTIFWYPFDFTWAVRRTLWSVQPALVILAELELWPNFLRSAKQANVPVVVVNGRLGEKSFHGYQRLAWIARFMFRQVDFFAVQSEEYAQRLQVLGADPVKIEVTGSVKFDNVQGNREHPKLKELANLFGVTPSDQSGSKNLTWIVGSTQEPEERWALEIYQELMKKHPGLRLILVPRHQERFDAVARTLEEVRVSFIRRSQLHCPIQDCLSLPPIILVDTLGELSYIWGLADLAFVGGSFNDRGGQNMIEPAAYGVPVMFGPKVWNFQQIADSLLHDKAAIQVMSKDQWRQTTSDLLSDPEKRKAIGQRAKAFVAKHQGATRSTVEIVKRYLRLDRSSNKQAA